MVVDDASHSLKKRAAFLVWQIPAYSELYILHQHTVSSGNDSRGKETLKESVIFAQSGAFLMFTMSGIFGRSPAARGAKVAGAQP